MAPHPPPSPCSLPPPKSHVLDSVLKGGQSTVRSEGSFQFQLEGFVGQGCAPNPASYFAKLSPRGDVGGAAPSKTPTEGLHHS